MPRWLRWILVSVAALVVLLVALLALLPTFIDVNQYRDQVVARVESALGREITLERLSLSFLPSPTLGLEGLVVGVQGAPREAPIPPGERFVTLARLDLKLRLLPLLARRIEVARLVLDRPQVVVERDARGVLSIADLLGRPGDGARPAPSPEATPGGSSPLGALLVERIEVRRGGLTFRDRAVVAGKEVTTTVSDLAVALDDVSLDRPVQADIRATFLSRTPENVALSGRLGPLGPAVDLPATPADLALKVVDLDLDQVAAYVGARTPRGKPAGAAGGPPPALTLAGTGSLEATVRGPLGAPALDAQVDLTPAAVAYAGSFTKKAGVPLTLAARTTRAQAPAGTPVIVVDPLTLTLHTLTLTAKGRIAEPSSPVVDLAVRSNEARLAGWDALVPALVGTTLGGRATLEATVKGRPGGPDGLDLAGTLRLAGLEVRHPSIPEPITDGEGTVRFTGKGAAIEPFRANLGKSPLTLRADLADYAKPYVRFALESPRLDLDPLIAAGAASSGGGPSPAGAPPAARGTPASEAQAPKAPGGAGGRAGGASSGAALAGLAADGTVRVAQGTLKGVDFTDLRGQVKLRDRVFTLDQLTFGLYGGQYAGGGTADLRGQAPAVTFASKVDKVKANDLLAASTSLKEVIFGLLSADLDVKGSGLDAASFRDSLAGDGKFSLTDGRIASFDLLERLQALVALAKEGPAAQGAAPAAGAGPKGTPVKSLSSSVRIEKGRFITPDLALSAGDFSLAGSGALGFDHSLAYNLTVALPAPLARQVLGRDVARLLQTDPSGRVEIPFRMGGSLTAPTVSLSSRFLEDRLRSRLEQSVGEKLQRGLDRLLQGGGREPAPGAAASPEGSTSAVPTPRPDPKQLLKDLLK